MPSSFAARQAYKVVDKHWSDIPIHGLAIWRVHSLDPFQMSAACFFSTSIEPRWLTRMLAASQRGNSAPNSRVSRYSRIQTRKRFKSTLFIWTKRNIWNFRGNPFYQATKQHLNAEKRWDLELRHFYYLLSVEQCCFHVQCWEECWYDRYSGVGLGRKVT